MPTQNRNGYRSGLHFTYKYVALNVHSHCCSDITMIMCICALIILSAILFKFTYILVIGSSVIFQYYYSQDTHVIHCTITPNSSILYNAYMNHVKCHTMVFGF